MLQVGVKRTMRKKEWHGSLRAVPLFTAYPNDPITMERLSSPVFFNKMQHKEYSLLKQILLKKYIKNLAILFTSTDKVFCFTIGISDSII